MRRRRNTEGGGGWEGGGGGGEVLQERLRECTPAANTLKRISKTSWSNCKYTYVLRLYALILRISIA